MSCRKRNGDDTAELDLTTPQGYISDASGDYDTWHVSASINLGALGQPPDCTDSFNTWLTMADIAFHLKEKRQFLIMFLLLPPFPK